MTADQIKAAIAFCESTIRTPPMALAHTIDTHSCTCPACTRQKGDLR